MKKRAVRVITGLLCAAMVFSHMAGNVNQIARRCNETGNLYREDVEDIRKGYVEIQKHLADAVGRLAKL